MEAFQQEQTMSKRRLVRWIYCIILCASPCFARIGEMREQIEKRLGKTAQFDTEKHRGVWEFGGLAYIVTFDSDGLSAVEMIFANPEAELSGAQVRNFMEPQLFADAKWTPVKVSFDQSSIRFADVVIPFNWAMNQAFRSSDNRLLAIRRTVGKDDSIIIYSVSGAHLVATERAKNEQDAAVKF